MSKEQEEDFSQGWDLMMGKELEPGRPPLRVQLEEVGQQVSWGQAVEPANEGSPLAPLGAGPIEVDSAEQVPEDGTVAEEAADKETDSLLQPS